MFPCARRFPLRVDPHTLARRQACTPSWYRYCIASSLSWCTLVSVWPHTLDEPDDLTVEWKSTLVNPPARAHFVLDARMGVRMVQCVVLCMYPLGIESSEVAIRKSCPVTGAGIVVPMLVADSWMPWYLVAWILATIVLTIIGLGKCGLLSLRRRGKANTRSVVTQSQVTYKFHYNTPRFAPLPEREHGAWVE